MNNKGDIARLSPRKFITDIRDVLDSLEFGIEFLDILSYGIDKNKKGIESFKEFIREVREIVFEKEDYDLLLKLGERFENEGVLDKE